MLIKHDRGCIFEGTFLLAIVFGVVTFINKAPADTFDCPSNGGKLRCIIAGCENGIRDKKWQDYRIAFGINELIAQGMFDSGRFAFVEQGPEIWEKLDALRSELWQKGNRRVFSQTSEIVGAGTTLVLGRLLSCSAPRTDVSFGPIHANETKLIIKVEVEMVLPSGKKIVGAGSGMSTRSAASAGFEFREDRILLEQSNFGMALRDAVTAAVADLLRRYQGVCNEDN